MDYCNPSCERLQENEVQKRNPKKELQKMQGKRFHDCFGRIIRDNDWQLPIEFVHVSNDGLSEELDEYKGIGNAVIPYIPEMIFSLPAFDLFREAVC